jgi:hypothetical protein
MMIVKLVVMKEMTPVSRPALGCRYKAAGSVRRRFRATESTLATVDTEKSTAAGFARALHHAPPTYRSLKFAQVYVCAVHC